MVIADDPTAPTKFAVILYDGKYETKVGDVKVHPDLQFDEFQMKLSTMTGIWYDNLTTYLIDEKKSEISPERRRILITDQVDFDAIAKEKNGYFYTVLKRPRRDRHGNPNQQNYLDLALVPLMSTNGLPRSHWNRVDMNPSQPSLNNPYSHHARFQNLLIQRANYVNVILNPRHAYNSPLTVYIPWIEDVRPILQRSSNRSLCEDCRVAQQQGSRAEFHLCVYDEVIVGGFWTNAGPISRPR